MITILYNTFQKARRNLKASTSIKGKYSGYKYLNWLKHYTIYSYAQTSHNLMDTCSISQWIINLINTGTRLHKDMDKEVTVNSFRNCLP